MLVSRSRYAPSCNKQLIKNEYVALKPKLKKNRMQSKMAIIESMVFSSVDLVLKRDARKLRAQKRRECSIKKG